MATTIKLKNSVTTTSVPSSLVQGEVAINITDKKVWVGNAATTPIQIAGAGTTGNAAGSNTQVQYNSSGSFAGDADFTFNGTTVTMANDASISGLTVGKGGGSNAFATAIGNGALAASNSGSVLAVGYQTLASNTTGDDITAIGSYRTLYTNTTGSYLVAVGRQALQANTTASFNTAIGHKSSFSNTTGANNSSLGYHSLYSNTTGSTNVGLGQEALYSNTTASNNTAVGFQAGYSNTTGDEMTAVGVQALYANTTGQYNTAVGLNALRANTTGNYNTAVGDGALRFNTTSNTVTAVGYQAGYNSTGANNTFIGTQAGYAVTTGAKNTVLGRYDGNQGGLDIRTANNWIVLSEGDGNARLYWDGTNSRWRAPSGQFQIQYAYDTTSGSAANVIVGSDGAMFRSTSALKYKTDVRDLENIDINKFRPVRYKSKSKIDDPTKDHIGIIADEVDAAGIKELVTYGIDGEVEGFQYERLTVVLLKAVQELTAKVEALEAQLNK
jgi:trimeric autotransporter adhesin